MSDQITTSAKTLSDVGRAKNADFVHVTIPMTTEKRMSELERFRRAVEEYNRRATAQNYRTWRPEEIQELIMHDRATLCDVCGVLILAGKHKKVDYNYRRHLDFNVRCLRVRVTMLSGSIN
jgi:hypothetical protein